jgi:uncharacterized protein YkwD
MIAAPPGARFVSGIPSRDAFSRLVGRDSSIWWMQKVPRHGIIPRMRRWMGSRTEGSTLRYSWLVAAVLAVLIAGVVGGQSASATSYDAEELQFLRLINEYRASNGLEPLLLSDTLSVSSERHSQDMARYRFFAHHTVASSYYPVGSSPWDRMQAEGYRYQTFWGENIAAGYESAERAFQAWRNSPTHNAAMLDGDYRVIGIARIYGQGLVHRWYWTTDFGGVPDPTAHTADESSQPEGPTATGDREEPVRDGASIENGDMSGDAVWEQEATDDADLILDGHARLGDYDNGRDEIRQEIRVGESTDLSYRIRIETTERQHPSDRLVVRLTNEEGKQLAVLERYTDGDAGGWRRDTVDLSGFAGRTVYLSFLVETDPLLTTAFYVDGVTLENGER